MQELYTPCPQLQALTAFSDIFLTTKHNRVHVVIRISDRFPAQFATNHNYKYQQTYTNCEIIDEVLESIGIPTNYHRDHVPYQLYTGDEIHIELPNTYSIPNLITLLRICNP